jgi:hypothetical protein
MANYLIKNCDDVNSFVVDPGINIIEIGSSYYFTFTGGTNPICGTVISEDQGIVTEGIDSVIPYENCLGCLQDNGFSFFAADCEFPEIVGPIDSIYFNELPFGKFYSLCISDPENPNIPQECFCLTFIGIIEGSSPFPFPVAFTGPFYECGCEPSRSANTEYFECVICCDCGSTGSTVTRVSPPHPVWTDGYGTPVTQMNMVTLGGMFGLNN